MSKKNNGNVFNSSQTKILTDWFNFSFALHNKPLNFLIEIGRSLGQGTFGKVRLGTHLITGEKVAIKILEKDKIKDQSDVERVTREIHILKIVRHPNVIQLYEVSFTTLFQNNTLIFMF